MRCALRMVPAPLLLGLLLGCGAKGSAGSEPAESVPGISASVSPTADRRADLKEGVLASAMAAGEAPTEAGVSDVVRSEDSGTFLWETRTGRLCLAQAVASGALDSRLCGEPVQDTPEPGSPVSRAFGPGTAPEGWMVVLLAEHSHRVTSVRFRGEEADWKFVRTLAPALSGRDVYYVPLRDAPTGDLELTFDVGGQQRKELLRFT